MAENRHATNLQGLLRFALEHTKKEDAPNESQFSEMDEERRQFLENALKSMTVDVIEEFHKAISALEDVNSPKSEKLEAFNVIRDFIDNIDSANNFVKIGGTTVLLNYLPKEQDSKLRVAATYIIAEMAQNNPFCQKHFVELGLIKTFAENLKDENEDIINSSLHALSTLVRSYDPGLVEFLKLGGIQILLSCLDTQHSRVFTKTCFLIASLSTEQTLVRDEFLKKSAVSKLCKHIEHTSGFDIRAETVLYALSSLTKNVGFKSFVQNKEQLREILKDIIESNKKLPQCEEIVAYARTILEALKD